MTVEVKVPTLPESVPDATLLDWKKNVGDPVAQDEILVELETDKVVLEVPAPQAGVLAEIVKNTGDTALADEVLARIDTDAKAAPAPAAAEPAPAAAPAASAADGDLSPAVRKLVEENELDAAAITGTGKGGRITKGDVLAHLEQKKSAPATPAPAPASPAPAAPAPAAPPSPARAPGSREASGSPSAWSRPSTPRQSSPPSTRSTCSP